MLELTQRQQTMAGGGGVGSKDNCLQAGRQAGNNTYTPSYPIHGGSQ